jgi:hypothetical protein
MSGPEIDRITNGLRLSERPERTAYTHWRGGRMRAAGRLGRRCRQWVVGPAGEPMYGNWIRTEVVVELTPFVVRTREGD